MTVMVDELRVWPTKIRIFKKGSCHLTTDGPLEELHAFAKALGLRREWFQPHPVADHYDLTPNKRYEAIQLGAMEVSFRDQRSRTLSRTVKR